jgi:DNA-binding NarL/FixJ family response regulator
MRRTQIHLPLFFGLVTVQSDAKSPVPTAAHPESHVGQHAGDDDRGGARPEKFTIGVATRDAAFERRLSAEFGSSAVRELTPQSLPAAVDDACCAIQGGLVLFADASLAQAGILSSPLLHRHLAMLRIVVVMDDQGPAGCELLLSCGARGCVGVDAEAGELARAVQAIHAGEVWVPRRMLTILYEKTMAEFSTGDARASVADTDSSLSPGVHLTHQEVRVVDYAHRGWSNKEIARVLGISENTVKKHLAHAFDKLGVKRRRQLIV